MASKNISITEELYNALLNQKMKDESFSDVIWRLLKNQRHDPLQNFGILKEEDPNSRDIFLEGIKKMRDHQRKLENKKKKFAEEGI